MIDGFLLEYPGFSKRLGNYTVKAKKITYNNSLPESLFSLDGFTIQTMEDYAKKSKEKEEKFREQRSRMIGIKAPNFSERSIKNKKLDSKKLLDQIIVYNFWFTTCPPCKAEIPKLNQLRDKYKDKNIEFIAIALDPEYLIQEYIQKNPFNYDIIAEGRWIAEKFEISSYPTNIVVDKKGVVQFYEVGYKSDIVERMSNEIDKIFSPEN
jgi:thiol-disulfide isomerase/thioredoxin